MSEPTSVRLTATISGRVQGVGYRFFVEAEANRLGLTGYVRNTPDGGVDVLAEGDRRVLEGFLAILRRGPSGANVTGVRFSFVPATGEFHDFSVRRWV